MSKFVPPSWFTSLKGKKGYTKKQVNDSITLSSDNSKRLILDSENTDRFKGRIASKGSAFSSLNVYKALVKILVSLLPDKYLISL